MDDFSVKCRVCKAEAGAQELATLLTINCRRRGVYRVTESAWIQLDQEPANFQLCAWIRSGGLKGQKDQLLTTHTFAELSLRLPPIACQRGRK